MFSPCMYYTCMYDTITIIWMYIYIYIYIVYIYTVPVKGFDTFYHSYIHKIIHLYLIVRS